MRHAYLIAAKPPPEPFSPPVSVSSGFRLSNGSGRELQQTSKSCARPPVAEQDRFMLLQCADIVIIERIPKRVQIAPITCSCCFFDTQSRFTVVAGQAMSRDHEHVTEQSQMTGTVQSIAAYSVRGT